MPFSSTFGAHLFPNICLAMSAPNSLDYECFLQGKRKIGGEHGVDLFFWFCNLEPRGQRSSVRLGGFLFCPPSNGGKIIEELFSRDRFCWGSLGPVPGAFYLAGFIHRLYVEVAPGPSNAS